MKFVWCVHLSQGAVETFSEAAREAIAEPAVDIEAVAEPIIVAEPVVEVWDASCHSC